MPKAEAEASFERKLVDKVGKEHKGHVQIAGDGTLDADVLDYISTQCATLDFAIGRPGIPTGTVTLLLGAEGSAKSTLAHHILIETQRRGGTAILVDAENRYRREWVEQIGMDHSRLIYITGDQPYEQILDELKGLIEEIRQADSKRLVTIAIDSLSACATEKQMKGEHKVGDIASVTSAFFSAYHSVIASHNIAFVIVNQYRDSINFMAGPYAQTKYYVAKNSLRYYTSLRIEMKQIQRLGDDKTQPEGILVEAEITKSNVAAPFRKAQFKVWFGVHGQRPGIDIVDAQLEVAKIIGLVQTGGGGYHSLDGMEKKFRAGEFPSVLSEHPDLAQAIAEAPLAWTKEASS